MKDLVKLVTYIIRNYKFLVLFTGPYIPVVFITTKLCCVNFIFTYLLAKKLNSHIFEAVIFSFLGLILVLTNLNKNIIKLGVCCWFCFIYIFSEHIFSFLNLNNISLVLWYIYFRLRIISSIYLYYKYSLKTRLKPAAILIIIFITYCLFFNLVGCKILHHTFSYFNRIENFTFYYLFFIWRKYVFNLSFFLTPISKLNKDDYHIIILITMWAIFAYLISISVLARIINRVNYFFLLAIFYYIHYIYYSTLIKEQSVNSKTTITFNDIYLISQLELILTSNCEYLIKLGKNSILQKYNLLIHFNYILKFTQFINNFYTSLSVFVIFCYFDLFFQAEEILALLLIDPDLGMGYIWWQADEDFDSHFCYKPLQTPHYRVFNKN